MQNSLDTNIVNSATVFEFKRKLNIFDVTTTVIYLLTELFTVVLRVFEFFIEMSNYIVFRKILNYRNYIVCSEYIYLSDGNLYIYLSDIK